MYLIPESHGDGEEEGLAGEHEDQAGSGGHGGGAAHHSGLGPGLRVILSIGLRRIVVLATLTQIMIITL